MHELSIAQEIFSIVDQYVPDDKSDVTVIRVKIGKFSNVIVDSLKFCFDAVKSDTELSEAELIVEEVPITVKCRECESANELENYTVVCQSCASTNTELIAGNELNVSEIELKD